LGSGLPCRRRDIPSTIFGREPDHAAPAHSARSPRRNPPMFRAAEASRQALASSRLPFPASLAALATVVLFVTPPSLNERRRRTNGSRPEGAVSTGGRLLSLVLRYQRNNVAALLASEGCQFRMRTKPRLPAMQLHDSAARLATRRHQLDVRKTLHFVAVRTACGRCLVHCRLTPAVSSMLSMRLRA
jgi:hypothetical protein